MLILLKSIQKYYKYSKEWKVVKFTTINTSKPDNNNFDAKNFMQKNVS